MELLYELKKTSYIKDAYDRWASYRYDLTDDIISYCKEGTSLMVIGAGAMNDLDLYQLKNHFSTVDLYDCEEDLQAYTDTTPSNDLSDTTIYPCHLTGLTDSILDDYSYRLSEVKMKLDSGTITTEEAYKDILFITEQIYDTARDYVYLPYETYDYIVIVGVHSQLQRFTHQIYALNFPDIASDPNNPFNQKMLTFFHSMSKNYAKSINDYIFENASMGAIIGLEANNPLNPGPIEGAHQAILDLLSRDYKRDVSKLIWPFYEPEKKIYEMLIFHY